MSDDELIEAMRQAWLDAPFYGGELMLDSDLRAMGEGGRMSELQRYGIEWTGPKTPICVAKDDGYWTPWHVANAELAALRAELESAHTAQRHAEKELAQYMAWYAMAEHQHLHEQRRAEKAEAEAARLRAAIEQAPHKLTCGWWGNKLDDIAGPDGKTRNCDCWKRAAIDAAMR